MWISIHAVGARLCFNTDRVPGCRQAEETVVMEGLVKSINP